MRNPLKRWDVALTLVFFLLTIPAERYEVFSLLEDQTISFRHILRVSLGDPELTRLREEIMIVALDEDLYTEYGSFPFRRTDLGKIAEILSGFGARVVALDFLMDFKSSYDEDEPTAKMFREADNVVLVSYASFVDGKFDRLAYPTEVLRNAATTGYSNLEPTSVIIDNLARLRIYPEITLAQEGWPFAIQVLSQYWGVTPQLSNNVLSIGDELVVELDQFSDLYIDFPALDSGTRYLSEGQAGFSALEILDLENVDPEEQEEWEAVFGDKIILVGDTWEVTHDKFNTPMGPVYGVEIIADTISTLMNGVPLRPASIALESGVTLVFLALLLMTGIFRSLGARILTAFLIYAVYLSTVTAAYIYLGLVITMTYGILTGFLVIIMMSLRQYVLSEERQRVSAADSAESNRMLGLAYQGQGQLDSAFDKYRSCPREEATFELVYNLGLDYERKRQYNKAQLTYEFIAESDTGFRDVVKRITRCASMEDAVMMGGATGVLGSTIISEDGTVEKPMLGRYKVEKELGKGAMGIVYLGKDPKINRDVAIKTMALAQEFGEDELKEVKERFFREAESAGRLNHANIVSIYDAGEENDLAYIAMELLKGYDLDAHIKLEDLLPIKNVLQIVIQCADGLDYAHTQNVVHRDIKPSNIMYDPDAGIAKITDFGIARITDSSKTRTGTVLGTPNYMSPEQCMGKKVDGRADLFSLGVVLYQLVSGSLPFKGDSMATLMYSIVNDRPVDIKTVKADINPALRKVIHNAIGKKPEKRYQTGKKMAAHLTVCLERILAQAKSGQSGESRENRQPGKGGKAAE
jgi:CHASE2 domain-containing sensor protein/tRNA A-37 threonylcarbamoyl transferase component Bud32